jgi:predicted RNA-binding Zn ribbon-like protein
VQAEAIPAELGTIQALVNTRDVEAGRDDIASPHELAEWLGQRGLLAPGEVVTDDDVERAAHFREALRALLRAQHDSSPDTAALKDLNALATSLPLCVQLDARGGARLEPHAGGVAGALASILGDVAVAMTSGTWARLKACSEEDCQWIFYDRSKNRSGRWCTMRVCGNRTKTRAYRERQRAERG